MCIRDSYLTANNIRIDVLELLKNAGSGHLGGSFSEAEILSVLFNEHLKFDPNNPKWDKRDRFILSKGHANPGLYAILAEKGFFSKDEFKNLRKINGMLQGHPERITPGIEYIAGFLGQGLSAGCGMALGFKRENKENQVFVLIGDGDNLEGQTWEAARFAVHNKLDNLTAIFDYNNILSDGTTESVLTINEPEKQWRAFGWNVITVNGHNVIQIDEALRQSKEIDAPLVAANDSHYVSKNDSSAHDALLCVQTNATMEDDDRFKFDGEEYYVKSSEEMRQLFPDDSFPNACDNTLKIADRVNSVSYTHLTLPTNREV